MTKQNVKAICDGCGKVWIYTGRNKVYITCPDCRKLVKLESDEKEVK
jgi:phage FluMu protein Com